MLLCSMRSTIICTAKTNLSFKYSPMPLQLPPVPKGLTEHQREPAPGKTRTDETRGAWY